LVPVLRDLVYGSNTQARSSSRQRYRGHETDFSADYRQIHWMLESHPNSPICGFPLVISPCQPHLCRTGREFNTRKIILLPWFNYLGSTSLFPTASYVGTGVCPYAFDFGFLIYRHPSADRRPRLSDASDNSRFFFSAPATLCTQAFPRLLSTGASIIVRLNGMHACAVHLLLLGRLHLLAGLYNEE
jgi:hypothetical protein